MELTEDVTNVGDFCYDLSGFMFYGYEHLWRYIFLFGNEGFGFL